MAIHVSSGASRHPMSTTTPLLTTPIMVLVTTISAGIQGEVVTWFGAIRLPLLAGSSAILECPVKIATRKRLLQKQQVFLFLWLLKQVRHRQVKVILQVEISFDYAYLTLIYSHVI